MLRTWTKEELENQKMLIVALDKASKQAHCEFCFVGYVLELAKLVRDMEALHMPIEQVLSRMEQLRMCTQTQAKA